MIVGNKKDLVDQRVVEMTEGAKFALENGKAFSHLIILECRMSIYGMLSGIRGEYRGNFQQNDSNNHLQN